MAYYGDGGSTPSSPYMNVTAGMGDSLGPKDPLTPGEIAGIVCAAIMVATLIGVAFYMRYRRGKHMPPKPRSAYHGAYKADDPRYWNPEGQHSTILNWIEFKPDAPGSASGSTLHGHAATNAGHGDGEGVTAQSQARKKTWAPWTHPKAKLFLNSQAHLAHGMV
ncbi:uncharacterized protein E0L32_005459 [Thyridium curvatum]|uniref:Uncharacterized protein n=1 Tax=Thyridium curvatum TaxID=1093900 RepID=A0A507AUK7_9PEZI|nr:uncharacterized protein E0L32_005459 [Thyridium curvatum]TPX14495.1 hypothetical protein E0L32_005459 [Thyridium curvatum]